MKIIKRILILLLIVLIVMQFFQPDKNTSEITPDTDIVKVTDMPSEVANILHVSCYDCHSNNTNYPWYNRVAPVSYWMADHVEEGKHHLNFSEWKNYNTKRKLHKLEEVMEEVKEGHMPIDEYLWMHSDARLDDQQIAMLDQWIKQYSLQIQIEDKPM